jgi:hypothetical protein
MPEEHDDTETDPVDGSPFPARRTPEPLRTDTSGRFSFEPALERVANALERLSPQTLFTPPSYLGGPSVMELLVKIAGTLERVEELLKVRGGS